MSELHVLTGGEKLWTHDKIMCDERDSPCSIHSPSMHHMLTWNMHWRGDRRIMERTCPHGVGHPDPDDAHYRAIHGDHDATHGCDGCCTPPVASDDSPADYPVIRPRQDQEGSDLQV